MWNILVNAFTVVTEDILLLLDMSVRAFIIYSASIVFIRFNRKFMGTRTPYNFLLFVVLGSASASAIVQREYFVPILGTMIFLILLNSLLTMLSFYFPRFEQFFIGSSVILIQDGVVQWDKMRSYYITENEIKNALQTQLNTDDFSIIEKAFLANDGTINFLVKSNNGHKTTEPANLEQE